MHLHGLWISLGQRRLGADQVGARWEGAGVTGELPEHRPQTPAELVASHRGARSAPDGEGHLRRTGFDPRGTRGQVQDADRTGPTASTTTERGEGAALPDAMDQADSRWRPLARRDFTIERPARSLIRCLNP